ncbi:MAG TPA: hypothetical protein VJ044_19385, partial [Candidatus Hodarchaeales archaeon]|nr:hypothetical protein [Candidatus Hodarchaeales archaeon]
MEGLEKRRGFLQRSWTSLFFGGQDLACKVRAGATPPIIFIVLTAMLLYPRNLDDYFILVFTVPAEWVVRLVVLLTCACIPIAYYLIWQYYDSVHTAKLNSLDEFLFAINYLHSVGIRKHSLSVLLFIGVFAQFILSPYLICIQLSGIEYFLSLLVIPIVFLILLDIARVTYGLAQEEIDQLNQQESLSEAYSIQVMPLFHTSSDKRSVWANMDEILCKTRLSKNDLMNVCQSSEFSQSLAIKRNILTLSQKN